MGLTQINKAGLDEIALDHVFTIGASGSSAYTFQGEGLNGTVNNPTLYLTRGKTYRFENGTGAHPIRIQSTSGASGTAYNTGVTNNAGSGTVIVEVQHDAPDILYYQCTSHAAMNGILYITGALADGGVTTAKIADDAVTDAKLANSINSAIAANTAKVQTTINNNADNRVITGSGTANTLNGEANLTFNSSLVVTDGNGTVTTGGNYINLKRTGTNVNYINAPLADAELHISADENIIFKTVHTGDFSSTERVRIDSSGNVGINTSSPSHSLEVNGNISLGNGGGSGGAEMLRIHNDNGVERIHATNNPSALAFGIGGTGSSHERMRLDASGRLIIGYNSDLSGGDSTALLQVTHGGGGTLRLVRDDTAVTSNENLGQVHFSGRDGGANVACGAIIGRAIGTHTTTSRPTAIIFNTTSSGSATPTERVRIQEGGGISFNGDTTQANALDDYEEGDYTVTLSGNNGNYSLHGGADRLRYIKIGKLVTLFGRIQITAHNNVNGTPRINLPFATPSANEQSGLGQFGVYWHKWNMPSDGMGTSSLEFGNSSSTAYFLYQRDNQSWSGLPDIRDNLGDLYVTIQGIYMAAS